MGYRENNGKIVIGFIGVAILGSAIQSAGGVVIIFAAVLVAWALGLWFEIDLTNRPVCWNCNKKTRYIYRIRRKDGGPDLRYHSNDLICGRCSFPEQKPRIVASPAVTVASNQGELTWLVALPVVAAANSQGGITRPNDSPTNPLERWTSAGFAAGLAGDSTKELGQILADALPSAPEVTAWQRGFTSGKASALWNLGFSAGFCGEPRDVNADWKVRAGWMEGDAKRNSQPYFETMQSTLKTQGRSI